MKQTPSFFFLFFFFLAIVSQEFIKFRSEGNFREQPPTILKKFFLVLSIFSNQYDK